MNTNEKIQAVKLDAGLLLQALAWSYSLAYWFLAIWGGSVPFFCQVLRLGSRVLFSAGLSVSHYHLLGV